MRNLIRYIPVFFLLSGCLLTNSFVPPAETVSGQDAQTRIAAAAAAGYYWGVNTMLDNFTSLIKKEDYFISNETVINASLTGIALVFQKNLKEQHFYTKDSVDQCVRNVREAAWALASADTLKRITSSAAGSREERLTDSLYASWEIRELCSPKEAGSILHVNHMISL